MGVKITDRWTNDGLKLQKAIANAQKKVLQVGYNEEQMHGIKSKKGGEMSTSLIAMWNELGTENMPKRPFLANSVDSYEDDIRKFIKSALNDADYNDPDVFKNIYIRIGEEQKKLIMRSILEGDYEPNAPSTVRAKGSDKPLVDTTQMLNTPEFVIRDKGEIE